jgi:alditol oxidase
MDKREFLRTSGAALTGSILSRMLHAQGAPTPRTNWAGNFTYSTNNLHQPTTVEEVRAVVKKCTHVRALGSRHSFNSIADSTENQISLAALHSIEVDAAGKTATVGAGIRYGDLAPVLDAKGFALHNLASLPHISVAGACATATHGSGSNNGNLATSVAAMEVVTADGEVMNFSRQQNGEQFQGMVVSLGGLGVVTKLTLDVRPTYTVRQDVYENLPLAELEKHYDAIFAGGYSVSLFTDWQKPQVNQVWLKRLVTGPADAPATFFGAKLVAVEKHPIAGISAENCNPQMGVPGPWHERLPHFRMDYTPSSGEELQAEYFVARQSAPAAISAIAQLRERIAPVLMISELRTIAADELWISPCYGRPTAAIHFTLKQDWPAAQELLRMVEDRLAPFQARPHWGKMFTMPPSRLAELYPKMQEFRMLLESFDPQGKFRNAFLDRFIFGR